MRYNPSEAMMCMIINALVAKEVLEGISILLKKSDEAF